MVAQKSEDVELIDENERIKKTNFFQENISKQDLITEKKEDVVAIKEQGEIKRNVLESKSRIFPINSFDALCVDQIVTILYRLDLILIDPDTSTLIRVKLYELLSTFVKLDKQTINDALASEEHLLACVINDFERYENNSVVLKILAKLVEELTL